MSTNSLGGIFVHPKSHIKIKSYSEDSQFSDKEKRDWLRLLKDLIFIANYGRKANIRRNLASLNFPDGNCEECTLSITIEGEKHDRNIGEFELLFKSKEGKEYYCDSSIIFSVAKYRYFPPKEFITAVSDETERIARNMWEFL